ncbi:MAG: Si-specific NAD(P)(+) transhydrogenase [Chlamydiales bacterium]
MDKYDLIVIGTGPAGEKAAVKAAYFHYKVAIIEKAIRYGGAGVNTGTLPSKTLKETSLYLSGKYDQGLYGIDRNIEEAMSIKTFMYRKNWIIETESNAVRNNLIRHGVDIYHGEASFLDANTIKITKEEETILLKASYIIIATGSYPFHPKTIPFDGVRIHDSDMILNITHYPLSLAVLGAGVIGCEYATIFSTSGTKVSLINRNENILPFIDQQIVRNFIESMQNDHIDLLFNQSIAKIEPPSKPEEKVKLIFKSGGVLSTDMFLFAAGRNGNTKALHLDRIGITVTSRETIPINENYQTVVPNIYAVGDVIGFPALASAGMDQGRIAVAHIFHTKDIEEIARIFPYGIYTIPEISTAGISEEEAKQKGFAYATGVAYHKDMPRGKIMGIEKGLLKLIFSRDDLVVQGVHIIGPLATELIHHGVGLIEGKRTILDIIGKVYNHPTLHDLYKYAAYDGLGNVSGYKIK